MRKGLMRPLCAVRTDALYVVANGGFAISNGWFVVDFGGEDK
jgi:hypothetical protein